MFIPKGQFVSSEGRAAHLEDAFLHRARCDNVSSKIWMTSLHNIMTTETE
jgi:hypothetical protein